MKSLTELVFLGERYLRNKGIASSLAASEMFLMNLTLCNSRAELFVEGKYIFPKYSKIRVFFERLRKRASRYPVQYILGQAAFFENTFFVNEDVLIPRAETELLVLKCCEWLSKKKGPVLEIGVGSGCISVSLALKFPDTIFEAVDVSPKALSVAKKNAQYFGVENRINFRVSDCFDGLNNSNKFDLIVSNPPYISDHDFEFLEPELFCEPFLALKGGEDGLDFYRRIISKAPEYLNKGAYLALEFGAKQSFSVVEILRKNKFKNIVLYKDYANFDRGVMAEY